MAAMVVVLCATAPAAHPAPARVAAAAARPCSAGLVALTFDDGPLPRVTARLLDLLERQDVPATFFMVGSRVHASPRLARRVARAGFAIGNHTWSHPQLTRRSDRYIRTEILRTARELRRAGIRPTTLMRPPYGDVNARVRTDVARLGLVPVLWTIDSNDWRGGSARDIAGRILGRLRLRLRPHRDNIVLQHDGVWNAPASVASVPLVVRAARARGYCFTGLDARGRVAVPVPSVAVTVEGGSEAGPVPARVLLTLSTPTSRPVSVHLTTASGTATAGVDFVPVSLRVTFPAGTTTARVDVPVLDDADYEPVEDFHLLLDRPDGLTVLHPDTVGTITGDDRPPPL